MTLSRFPVRTKDLSRERFLLGLVASTSAVAGTIVRSLSEARRGLGLGLGLALLLAIGSSSAIGGSILGDTVTIEYLYPNSTTLYGLSSTGVVTASGVTLDLFGNQSVTVLPNSVEMQEVLSTGSFFQSAAFNGVSVQDLTNPSAFSGFSIDPATTIAAFNISDVSLTGGLLFINYQGLTTPFPSLAQVDFTTSTTATPEPSALLISLLGLGAIVAMRRRMRV